MMESTDMDYKSALAAHAATSNHIIDWDNVKELEQEQDWKLRGIKEAIQIRANPQSLNRPQGERHILPNVWDSLLQQHQEPLHRQPPQDQGRGRGPRGPTNWREGQATTTSSW